MNTNNNYRLNPANRLAHTVILSVSLYAEFGCRGTDENDHNNVTEPENEGLYLSRLARKWFEKTSNKQEALEMVDRWFGKEIYNKNKQRNDDSRTAFLKKYYGNNYYRIERGYFYK